MIKFHGREKILIIKPSAFGDIIHAFPLLDRLKSAYPDIFIGWVVNREYADLLENNPLVNRVYFFDRKRWGRKRNIPKTVFEFLKLAKVIKREKYDVVIDLQGLLRSGLVAFFSAARYRIGLSDAREGSRYCYNHVVPVHDRKRHAIDRYLIVGDYLALGNSESSVRFPIHWSDTVEHRISQLLKKDGIKQADLKIAINPNARWKTKCWEPEKCAQLADILMDSLNAKVVFVGSPADTDSVENIVARMKNKPVSMAGKTSVLDLACLLKNMDLLITSDSGPMHMAVAVGIPVIALFGPTDPEKTGPYGDSNMVIHKNSSCEPCFKRACENIYCMKSISVEEVVECVHHTISKTAIKKTGSS